MHTKSASSSTLGSESKVVLYTTEENPHYTYREELLDACVTTDCDFVREEDVCFPIVVSKSDISFDSDALHKYLTAGQYQVHRSHTTSKRKSLIIQDTQNNGSRQITFFSPQTGSIRANNFSNLASEKSTLADLLSLDTYWIDFLNPSDNDLKWIGRIFQIHPLTIEDIQRAEIREKCESFWNYYFVSVQTFDVRDCGNSRNVENPISVYNVVMKNCILTFHYLPIYHPEKVLLRYDHLKDYLTLSPDWVNYALIDSIVDDFIPLEKSLEHESNSIDELVFILKHSEQADMLRRIGRARKALSGLLRTLKPKADVVRAVIKRIEALKIKEKHEFGLYLGDVQDHILSMVQSAEHFEKKLSRAHSNYLAQISIEITHSSDALNNLVAKLTILGTILLPMHVIAGLWGMNVKVPGKENASLVWFFGIVGFMVALFVVCVIYFKRMKMI
ncbi:CorA metal ion transporter [Basidiobolus ranarum]|uniref:CorA metal ion transporter n=1 Tax=Basidiobolus ranarum TaxID=34480 RepID=A0ABR2VUD2_9FUNG